MRDIDRIQMRAAVRGKSPRTDLAVRQPENLSLRRRVANTVIPA
jgi:hypothetical protein